jgi:DNA ligase-1
MTFKPFKPMLAPNESTDVSLLKYPLLASIKYDGIRATVQNGVLLSRNLKPLPNRNAQKKFSHLPEGFDGELLLGDPTDKHVFSKTTSVVMSDDKPADDVRFYAFDVYHETADFEHRLKYVYEMTHGIEDTQYVRHKLIHNEEELLSLEKEALEHGHEGLMLRSPNGPYKQGRVTVKQGWLLKLKRFVDAEAKILGFVEEQENTNEAVTNALGRSERSSKKEGMVGKGMLGKFEVIGANGQFKDVEFSIGGGFTAAQRQYYWNIRKKLVGGLVKYKYFPTGSKDKPRFPVFLGFRDKRDM